jgi:RNA polymerase sigma-70 factor (ECF subfamily)
VQRVALARALQALPADQRRAIVLYHLCDLSVAEVAAEVNAPTGTVKARLSRGRAALATLLGDSEEARRG